MAHAQLGEELLATIADAVEGVSESFDRWEDPRVHGPGLYVVVVDGTAADFCDPMGNNRWPVERCRSLHEDPECFETVAGSVGTHQDGAVVVQTDGTIQAQMVRLHDLNRTRQPTTEGGIDYEGWMGTRHRSALEATLRENVVGAVTLSEEDGRVSVFVDGELVR